MHIVRINNGGKMKKRVFRTHYILAIGGRLFTVLLVIFPLFMLSLLVRDFENSDIPTILFSIVFIAGLTILDGWILKYLWVQYVSIRVFSKGNVMRNRDLYNTGFLYIIISAGAIPNDRLDKIYSKQGLIKFNFSSKLGAALIDIVPNRYAGLLKQYIKK